MTTSPKPPKRLPENPSEENLRKQAKQLAKDEGLQLAAAQRRLANEYGFQNWAALMAAVVDRCIPLLPLRELIVFPHDVYPVFVGRTMSIKAVEAAALQKRPLLLVAQKDSILEAPSPADMYEVGTLCAIAQWMPLPNGTLRAVVEGKKRARVSRFLFDRDFYRAEAEVIKEAADHSTELEELRRAVISAFDAYVEHQGKITLAMANAIQSDFASTADPAILSDKMVRHLNVQLAEQQALLETADPAERLERILGYLSAEV
jgi:ATP-dependent Lon protease